MQFRKFIRIHWVLLALLLTAAAFFFKTEKTVTAQLGEHSFSAPVTWANDLTREQGWAPEHPRLLADINGDHKQDVVGFGNDGTWVALSNGTSNFTPALVLGDFGFHAGGWRANLHERAAGDVNGDHMDDIVGFGNAGVYRSLATGNGALGPVEFVVADFGYDQGWRNDKHVRLLADVNGDTRKDIVGFGTHGVWVSLSMSTNGDFSAPFFAVGDFGTLQGWNNVDHIRTTADVNGDTKQDIVGFGDHGVWVAFANGVGFDSPQLLLSEFAKFAGGWQVSRHPRVMADVNKDTKDDIVGFGYDGIWVSYSTGTGFTAPVFALADFGYNQGWRVGKDPVFEDDGHAHTDCTEETCGFGMNPRFVVDLNNDGYRDIVGFGSEAIYRSLGGPNGFGTVRPMIRDLVTESAGPWGGFEDVVQSF
ncbi:MAG TPA: VCBS repeat-containing protein, partial [Pyrinomonadaceae bacterium]|nr:VCBS repeat-containing protein [Pyrinomonadaceae bacterium]